MQLYGASMDTYRYTGWDDSQEPFPPSLEEFMDSMGDDLARNGDIKSALRKMTQKGFQPKDGQNIDGLRNMMNKLREQHQDILDKYDLNSIMHGIKEKLKEITEIEESTLQDRLQEAKDLLKNNENTPSQPSSIPNTEDTDSRNTETKIESSEKELADFLKNLEEEISAAHSESSDLKPSLDSSNTEPSSENNLDPSTASALENITNRKLDFLNELPEDSSGVIKELSEYDFMDSQAREKFNELLDSLKEQSMKSFANNMMDQLGKITPEDMDKSKDMLKDLNQMLRDREQGNNEKFDEFMQKWGDNFDDLLPENLDDLLDSFKDQMEQMQSLMNSLPADLKQELKKSMEEALGDPELNEQLNQFAQLMNQMMPKKSSQNYPFKGEESLSLNEAMNIMNELQKIEEVETQLQQAQRTGDLDSIDKDQLGEILGDEAKNNLELLEELQKRLEDEGFIKQDGEKLELTPKGIRKIGEKALRDIFSGLKNARIGNHELRKTGLMGEQTEENTKIYEFGDKFNVHMVRTVKNAVLRNGTGTPISLHPDDFEVYQDEQLTQSSTVILLDQSRSMAISGSFEAAKKMALALHTLIQMQFPRDNLYVVGFADYAWELKGQNLIKATWGGYSPGTNMQHALMLSRKLLNKHRTGTRQVLMVTDGEPTAHFEGGAPYFSYPPSPRTLDMTLREVKKCTNEGIVINVFMLEMAYYLVNFVRQMTKLNGGRAFFTQPDKLGEYVLVDYLKNKNKNY